MTDDEKKKLKKEIKEDAKNSSSSSSENNDKTAIKNNFHQISDAAWDLLDEMLLPVSQGSRSSEEEYSAALQQYEQAKEKLNHPVNTPIKKAEECSIGFWTLAQIDAPQTLVPQKIQTEFPLNNTPITNEFILKDINAGVLKSEDIIISNLGNNTFGQYEPKTDKILLNNPQEIAKDKLPQDKKLSPTSNVFNQYTEQNPIAMYSVFIHENTHKKHDIIDDYYSPKNSPAMAKKMDYLSETIAHAAEELAIVKIYADMKNKGLETYQYTVTTNGIEKTISMPLDDILDMYPGLRQTVQKNGYDINNTECVRAIIKNSQDYFKKIKKETYIAQAEQKANLATSYHNYVSVIERADILKNEDAMLDEKTSAMLQNIYIGCKTTLDLTPYKDLLNTMSNEEAHNISFNESALNPPIISDKKVLEVDNYLESLGLITAKAKETYLKEHFVKIVNRQPDADNNLSNILSDGGRIEYCDGMAESQNRTIIEDEYMNYNLSNIEAIYRFEKSLQSNNNTPLPQQNVSLSSPIQSIVNTKKHTR